MSKKSTAKDRRSARKKALEASHSPGDSADDVMLFADLQAGMSENLLIDLDTLAGMNKGNLSNNARAAATIIRGLNKDLDKRIIASQIVSVSETPAPSSAAKAAVSEANGPVSGTQ